MLEYDKHQNGQCVINIKLLGNIDNIYYVLINLGGCQLCTFYKPFFNNTIVTCPSLLSLLSYNVIKKVEKIIFCMY